MVHRRRLLMAVSAGLFAPVVWGQTKAVAPPWPTQTIRLLVGFPAGSSPDMLARALAEPLAKRLGQPVIVENKPGASGNIAVDLVAKATDGHTIGLSPNGPLTSSRFLFDKLPYDPDKDLAAVSLVATSPLLLVAPTRFPATTMPEALLVGRNQGDKLNYGSVGKGSAAHLTMELLKIQTGIKPVHIPFQGFPAVITAMLGGQIDLAFVVPSVAMPHVKSGRLKVLGVSSSSRSTLVPEFEPISTTANLPRFNAEVWNGVVAPKSMPAATVARLGDEINTILRTPATRQTLFNQSWQVVGGAPESLSRRMRDDSAVWGGVVQIANVRLD